jgi:hypothetical protein
VKRILFIVPLLLALVAVALANGRGPVTPEQLVPLAKRALSPDAATATAAVGALRHMGPPGLEALLITHDDVLRRGPSDSQWRHVADAIDQVAGQRDAWASRLYWYTDLAQAEAAAKESGKPILSLRLLGRLDEELSCANSRFFRTALYANREVAAALRDRFVLHWQSVRPAPRITIDFGDGRRLERTVTGNSVHWVLDAQGRPVDAIPGLYGPQEFLNALNEVAPVARAATALDEFERRTMLLDRYAVALSAVQELALREQGIRNVPRALEAGVAPTTKAAVERPILARLESDPLAFRIEARTARRWDRVPVAEREAKLDASSLALMEYKLGLDGAAMRPMVASFERSMAEDQERNERQIRPRVRALIARSTLPLDALTDRVYGDVFLTPSTDPWLGLLPADTYAALDHNGVVETAQEGTSASQGGR